MVEGPTGADLELLRSGIRLIALSALGDPDAADEVAQESLARAVKVLNSPERPANLGAYVAGIARHVIADYFRAKARTVPLDHVDPGALHAETPDALSTLCSESEAVGVRAALQDLSGDDRDLLRLCFFEGLSPTDIAGQLGVPPERIRQRKLRALERLRTAFDRVTPARHAEVPGATVRVTDVSATGRGAQRDRVSQV